MKEDKILTIRKGRSNTTMYELKKAINRDNIYGRDFIESYVIHMCP